MYTILHITDGHSGLMAGLIAPGTKLEYDNGEIIEQTLTSTSLWVWECYGRMISTTIDWAEGDPVVVYYTGDTTHGSTFPDYLYSGHQDHQVVIAVNAIEQLRRIPTLAGIRFCYGTAAHDYGMASAAKQITASCAAWGYPVSCVSYGIEDLDGCQVDYAHRGPGVGNAEDKSTTPRKYAIRLVRKFLERGQRAPDVILRGHVHVRSTGMVNVPWGKLGKDVLMSVGAPLTGPNEYARNASQNQVITEVGGTLIRVRNGRPVDWQAVTFEREERVHVGGVLAHPFTGTVNTG
jgi:hypothetical protein